MKKYGPHVKDPVPGCAQPMCLFRLCKRRALTKHLCDPHYKQHRRGRRLCPIGEYRCPRPLLSNAALPGVLFVQLTQGYFALIDEADAGSVGCNNWSVYRNKHIRYAQKNFVHRNGKKQPIYLHVFLWRVWGRPDAPELDHRNTDGLDCRHHNVRAATQAQNRWNRGAQVNNTSGHKGVSWNRALRRWDARIKANGVQHYLGLFDTVEEAAAAYKAAAQEFHGVFSRVERSAR